MESRKMISAVPEGTPVSLVCHPALGSAPKNSAEPCWATFMRPLRGLHGNFFERLKCDPQITVKCRNSRARLKPCPFQSDDKDRVFPQALKSCPDIRLHAK